MRITMNASAAGPDGVFISGRSYDVDDTFAKVLLDGGYASPAGVPPLAAEGDAAEAKFARSPQAADVHIPEDWRKLSANELKELASVIATPAAANRNEAIEVVAAELAARGV